MTSHNNNHTSDTADSLLVPSQAINSSRSNPNRNNNNNRQRRQRAGPRQSDSADRLPNPSASSVPTPGIGVSTATTATASVEQQQQPGSTAAPRSSNKKGRANNRRKNPAAAAAQQQPPALPDTTAAPSKLLSIQPKKKRNNNSNKKNQQRHAWWRSQVPKDAVDPITLDPLVRLSYPPFALMAHEPYVPIDWPPVNNHHRNDNKDEELVVSEAERQRRILQEQWGSVALGKTKTSDSENDPEDDTKKPAATGASTEQNQKQQHVNLFDGRALAYYMVSQLQFIDPLNRRDLTRDELVHLDRYLRRHLFLDLNVCEAYDAKGVSLSTAGAAAPTPSGRARILQDEARNLLQALFGSPSSSSSRATASTSSNNNTNATTTNSLAQLYQQHEAAQQQQMQNNAVTLLAGAVAQQDMYFQEDSPGLHVIDDDLNPGLRGNAAAFVPTSLYSASHIVSRNHSSPREQDFPSLQAAAVAPSSGEEAAPVKKNNLPPAKTLAKIGSLVQKTDPEELQRQWEAREEARKKALLSNLTFGSNHALQNEPARNAQGFPAQITTSNTVELSEAQLERNRAFAEALGVVPATQRSNLSAGWQRPADGRLLLDEYGVELNLTQYPESLVVMAREQISATFLLKLEKKWKTFLADDTAASLPLNPMDRPTRAFVHAYSEYWKLRTESFDREPKRYIHCVKLRETSAPYPLLSVALPYWQRPMAAAAFGVVPDHSSRQTAGQTTQQPSSLVVVARELAPGPDRVPLTLKPRTAGGAVVVELPPSSNSTGVSISGTRHRSMEETNVVSAASTSSTTTDTMSGGRFQGLVERERPKLELQKRTQPLEDLPPLLEAMDEEQAAAAAAALKQRQQAKAQRERALAARQEQVLAQAFASDDEDDDEDAPKPQLRGGNDSDSDWEEQPAMFVGEEEDDTA